MSTNGSSQTVTPPARVDAQLHPAWLALLALTCLGFSYHLWFVFLKTPPAQEAAGGLAQKIFYFHVPAAYAMYLSGTVCFVASCAYLLKATQLRNAWARAGAEGAVVFGVMVLISGPLWARKAWGVYWTWDPRLTTLMLSVLVYLALVVLRRFTGDGNAERRFAAAFGVLGTTILPVIHYSVRLWRGNHPTVVGKGGGGLGSPEMVHALSVGFGTMTLLCVILVMLRAHLAALESRLAEAEELSAALGLTEGDEFLYEDE
jgi:heme exporter protein C